MALKHLVETFAAWKESGDRLVLGTVYETAGSTYSKSGSRVLIDGEGNYQGLVSGGCLEGDLAEHAAAVLASGRARSLCYDMRGEHDILFGTGVGCDGMLKVLLQPLSGEGERPWGAAGADVRTGAGHNGVTLRRRGRRRRGAGGQHLPRRRGAG